MQAVVAVLDIPQVQEVQTVLVALVVEEMALEIQQPHLVELLIQAVVAEETLQEQVLIIHQVLAAQEL
jgi:hypothetical protein